MQPDSLFCTVSLAPLRAKASDASEMVSQLLFGERFEVLDKKANWRLIKTAFDAYEAWIDEKLCRQIPEDTDQTPKLIKSPFVVTQSKNQPSYWLPAGSEITLSETHEIRGLPGHYLADTDLKETAPAKLPALAGQFLHAPYLWGGRSLAGFDCSGFVQIVFKLAGIPLLRDAYQQALQGAMIDFISEAKAGDLAFFDNEEGQINHVGLLTGDGHIIHASGWVRMDKIDHQGIYNADLKKYTHKLRIIRRLL